MGQGNSVLYRFHLENLDGGKNSPSLASICMRTISPFFSSQERMTQAVVIGGRLKHISQMPLKGANPFGWKASETEKDNNSGILCSFDGSS